MSEPVRVDISAIVGTMIAVAMKPYADFVNRLRDEGRVSDDELASLRAALLEAVESVGQRTRERLAETPPDGWAVS
jgi:hypothetical protein